MNFFKKLSYSVGDITLYPNMIKQGLGKAFLYIFLFTLVFGTINSVFAGYKTNKEMNKFITNLKGHIPEFTFYNGRLNVSAPMPIIFRDSENNVIIIDTTGNTTKNILKKYKSATLVLNDRLIIKRNSIETRIYSFENFKEMTFNKQDVLHYIPYLKWISVIYGVMIWILFFIGKLVSALILSVINLIISKVRKIPLTFSQLYSLSIYSLSTPIILSIILMLFYFNLPMILYYIIALVYSWLAIGQFKKQHSGND